MKKRIVLLLGLLLCGCSETVCEPCQSFSAPTCEERHSSQESKSETETISSEAEWEWRDDAESIKIVFFGGDPTANPQWKWQDAIPFVYRELSEELARILEVRYANFGPTYRYVNLPYVICYKEAES